MSPLKTTGLTSLDDPPVVEQAIAGRRITVPPVRPEALARAGLLVDIRHHGALCQQVPARPAGREARVEPGLLTRAELRPLFLPEFGTVADAIAPRCPGVGQA